MKVIFGIIYNGNISLYNYFLYFFLKTDKKDYIETPIENYVESEVKENDKTEM